MTRTEKDQAPRLDLGAQVVLLDDPQFGGEIIAVLLDDDGELTGYQVRWHGFKETSQYRTSLVAPEDIAPEALSAPCSHPPAAWRSCERCRDAEGDLRLHERN